MTFMIHGIVEDFGDSLEIQLSDGTNWMEAFVHQPLYSHYKRGGFKENAFYTMKEYALNEGEHQKELVIVSFSLQ